MCFKRCHNCKEVKEIYEFIKSSTNKNGLASWCKPCRVTYYIEKKPKFVPKVRKDYQLRSRINRLKHVIANSINSTLSGSPPKDDRIARNVLCCDLPYLVEYLKSTAIKNYGFFSSFSEYEVDHIVPLSSDKSEIGVICLNHYTNLQLLTPKDNSKKSNKCWDIVKSELTILHD